MTGASSNAPLRLGLGLIALLAFGLRVFPFFGPEGAWSYRVDYDEGVYFSAAGWMAEGLLPWRDFVFVHPPGHLLFLLSTSVWLKGSLGLTGAFAVSRWIAACLGVINTLLVGTIVSRLPRAPLGAPLLAAAMYATYSEVAQVERGPFIEPVLNLLCLSMTLVLAVAENRERRQRWVLAAGVLAGLAVGMKLWAGLWIVGALFVLASHRERLTFLVCATVVGGLLILPFAAQGPSAFLEQALLFHARRPPDGTVLYERLGQIWSIRHLASPLIAMCGFALIVLRLETPPRMLRGALVTWGLTLIAFAASAAWWNQYNSHLIASEALVAGLVLTLAPRLRPFLMLFAVVMVGFSIAHTIRRAASPNDEQFLIARSKYATSSECVFSFEPSWSIAANRLPPRETGPLIDSYAAQLIAVTRTARFASADDAFRAQTALPPDVADCAVLMVRERAGKQVPLEVLQRTHHLEGDGFWRKN
jgi:hypothetical protein